VDPTIKDFESRDRRARGHRQEAREGDLALEASLQLYERGVHSRASVTRDSKRPRAHRDLNERGEAAAPPGIGVEIGSAKGRE
jgi:hypothetical protein